MLVLDQLGLRVVLTVQHAIDRVALGVEEFSEESSVLASDTGDEGGGHPGEATDSQR
jgi:hypothetical protein